MRAASAPSGVLAVDTTTKMTPSLVRALSQAQWNGESICGIGRYVSLRQVNTSFDISQDELALIVDPANDAQGAGLGCWLVQHCRYGVGSVQSPDGWMPNEQLGSFDGMVARRHAALVEYPVAAHIALDFEGVNPAAPKAVCTAHCDAWAESLTDEATNTPTFLPLLYDGYSPVLAGEEIWQLPTFHAYWRGGGGPVVPHRGFVLEQVALDVVVAGVKVDINRVHTDALGGNLVWCVA
jgi:hypothetical protein